MLKAKQREEANAKKFQYELASGYTCNVRILYQWVHLARVCFEDIWLAASGMASAEIDSMADAQGPMMLLWRLLITLAQALGLLWVKNIAGQSACQSVLKLPIGSP